MQVGFQTLAEQKVDRRYNPLPFLVYLKESKIHGYGIFAKKNIAEEIFIGISHMDNNDFIDNLLRTPLGGFINHSDNPNCIRVQEANSPYHYIKTTKFIKKDEELTCKYSLYSIGTTNT